MVWAVSSTGQRSQQPVMSTIPYGTGWGSGGIWGWELIPPHPSATTTASLSRFQGRSLAKPSAKSSGEPASQGRWVGWAWAQRALGAPGSDGSCFIPPRNPFIIFSGGMPRASYGDRHCVSVLQGQTLATLDFTSRVIDFFTVQSAQVPEGGTSWGLGPPWGEGTAVGVSTCSSHLPPPQASRTPEPWWCWWRRSWWPSTCRHRAGPPSPPRTWLHSTPLPSPAPATSPTCPSSSGRGSSVWASSRAPGNPQWSVTGMVGRGPAEPLPAWPCGLHPSLHPLSIPPSRLGPLMGGRTWPRSPRRGAFSSPGEWAGSREGAWETQNGGGGNTFSPVPVVGE